MKQIVCNFDHYCCIIPDGPSILGYVCLFDLILYIHSTIFQLCGMFFLGSLGSSLIIFSSFFYFTVPWSKMTAWGTLISIDSATWSFPQILRGKAKSDNAIG